MFSTIGFMRFVNKLALENRKMGDGHQPSPDELPVGFYATCNLESHILVKLRVVMVHMDTFKDVVRLENIQSPNLRSIRNEFEHVACNNIFTSKVVCRIANVAFVIYVCFDNLNSDAYCDSFLVACLSCLLY